MKTKNTIITWILATTLLLTANVNAEELAQNSEETLSVVSTEEVVLNEFAFSNAPEAGETTDTTVDLSWEKLDGALYYVVSYGEISVEKSEWKVEFYDNEIGEWIETNEFKVQELIPNTTYYFAVTAIDENGNETKFSPELELTTEAASVSEEGVLTGEDVNTEENAEVKALEISNVEVASIDQLKVTLNKELDDSAEAIREFRIIEKMTTDEIMVSTTELSEDKISLVLNLDGELKTESEYELTVLALNAKDGTNIESWVEGIRSFTTPAVLNTVFEPTDVELNAAPEEVSTEDTVSEVKEVQAKKLPQTWAEEVVVLFLALILSGLVFIRKRA